MNNWNRINDHPYDGNIFPSKNVPADINDS